MATLTLQHAPVSRPVIGLGLTWLFVIVILAAQGAFDIAPGSLPVGFIIAALTPPALVLTALGLSGQFRAAVGALDPVFLTSLQSWRVLGGLFLVLLAFGQLPGLFAWPAGVGDVAIGLAAPFVVLAVIADRKFIKTTNYRWFHYLGLFDFVVAFATAFLAGGRFPGLIGDVTTGAMGHLPLAIIPAFLVPAFIIAHILALYQAKHT
jgi:hypothetical protein